MKRTSVKVLISASIIFAMIPFYFVNADEVEYQSTNIFNPYNAMFTWYRVSSNDMGCQFHFIYPNEIGGTYATIKYNDTKADYTRNANESSTGIQFLFVNNANHLNINGLYTAMVYYNTSMLDANFEITARVRPYNENTWYDIEIYESGYASEYFYIVWNHLDKSYNGFYLELNVNNINYAEGKQFKYYTGPNAVRVNTTWSYAINNNSVDPAITGTVENLKQLFSYGIYMNEAYVANSDTLQQISDNNAYFNTIKNAFDSYTIVFKNYADYMAYKINQITLTPSGSQAETSINDNDQTNTDLKTESENYQQIESEFNTDFDTNLQGIDTNTWETRLTGWSSGINWLKTQMNTMFDSMGDYKYMLEIGMILAIALIFIGR